MGTKPVRVEEPDHETLQELANSHDTSIAQVVSEILEIVDVDELQDRTGTNCVGLCPECGAQIPAKNVSTGVLTGAVRAECPAAERNDNVHEDQSRGKYMIEDLDEA